MPRKIRGRVCPWDAQYLRREANRNLLVPYEVKACEAQRGMAPPWGVLSKRLHLSWQLKVDTFLSGWWWEKELIEGQSGQAQSNWSYWRGNSGGSQHKGPMREEAGLERQVRQPIRKGLGAGWGVRTWSHSLVQVSELVSNKLVRRYIQWM